MIGSFKCKETEKIYGGDSSGDFPRQIQNTALRKLRQIAAVTELNELRQPPGNRLEKLKRDRVGQHSIRINDQWRVCFVWKGSEAHSIEIVDYH